MSFWNHRHALLPGIVLATLVGCGDAQRLATAPVSGRVTVGDQPVTKGQVIFTPEQGRSAKGTIGPDGAFTLSTYADGDGAIVGKHRIAVISVTRPADADPQDLDVPSIWLIPQRYGNASTSGLSYEVTADGANDVTLELSTK